MAYRRVSSTLNQIAEYVEANYGDRLSLRKLGATHGIDRKTIQKYYKSRGKSFSQYLKCLRLRKARQILCDGSQNRTISSVALECGFTDHGTFSKLYREAYGELPSQTLLRRGDCGVRHLVATGGPDSAPENRSEMSIELMVSTDLGATKQNGR